MNGGVEIVKTVGFIIFNENLAETSGFPVMPPFIPGSLESPRDPLGSVT